MKDIVLPFEAARMDQNPLNFSDMELIDVLWRQDIDLGVGREMYDVNLRQEMEKELEHQLQKEKEFQKEAEKEKEESKTNQQDGFPVLDMSANYIIDGETGEFVVGPPISHPEISDVSNFPNFENQLLPDTPQVGSLSQPNFRIADLVGIMPDTIQSREPSQPLATGDPLFDLDALMLGTPVMPNTASDLLQMPEVPNVTTTNTVISFSRQNSFEQGWEDVIGLLGLPDDAINSPFDLDLPNAPATPTQQTSIVQNVSLASVNMIAPLSVSQTNAPNTFSLLSNEPDFDDLTFMSDHTDVTSSIFNDPISAMPFTATNESFSNVEAPIFSSHVNEGLSDAENVTDMSAMEVESLFQQLLQDERITDNSLNLTNIDFNFDELSVDVNRPVLHDDVSSDSAVSSMASPLQWCRDVVGLSDGTDGATGGRDEATKDKVDYEKYLYKPNPTYRPTLANQNVNLSCSSNDTSSHYSTKASAKNLFHNHTYFLQPGQLSREQKEAAIRQEKEQKATRSRDDKKAKEMKLPFSVDEIISTPVEEFNHMLSRVTLSEGQLQLIRDIRRRGKNKQAAQNCRKRKLDTIQSLEDEVGVLQRERNSLLQERRNLDRETTQLKDKYVRLQEQLFRSLRDDSGRPYNPNEYSLQQLPDGNMFLVPKNSTSAEKTHMEKPGRKRKPKRKE